MTLTHDAQGEVGDDVENDDGDFEIRQIPEVGLVQRGFIETEQLAMDACHRVPQGDHRDRGKHQQSDVDDRAPAEKFA